MKTPFPFEKSWFKKLTERNELPELPLQYLQQDLGQPILLPQYALPIGWEHIANEANVIMIIMIANFKVNTAK